MLLRHTRLGFFYSSGKFSAPEIFDFKFSLPHSALQNSVRHFHFRLYRIQFCRPWCNHSSIKTLISQNTVSESAKWEKYTGIAKEKQAWCKLPDMQTDIVCMCDGVQHSLSGQVRTGRFHLSPCQSHYTELINANSVSEPQNTPVHTSVSRYNALPPMLVSYCEDLAMRYWKKTHSYKKPWRKLLTAHLSS